MLTAYIGADADPLHDNTYNEIILDPTEWERNLPASIEAFWFPKTDECKDEGCDVAAWSAHKEFLAHYGLDEDLVPLLELRMNDFNTPFALPKRDAFGAAQSTGSYDEDDNGPAEAMQIPTVNSIPSKKPTTSGSSAEESYDSEQADTILRG